MASVREPAASGLAAGVLTGALWCLPAALRAHADAVGWLALWGSAALLMGPLLVSVRPLASEPRRSVGSMFALLLAAGPLAQLAAMLETKTHHRPLGGATFAIIAAGIVCGCLVAMQRLERQSRALRLMGRIAAAASGGVALMWIIPAFGEASVQAAAVDVVLAILLVLFAARAPVPLGAVAVRLAPWGWAVVVAAGLGAMGVAGGSDLVAAAPAVAGVGQWVVSGLL